MSTAYKFDNPHGVYFVSFATVQWVDVFVRKTYQDIVLNSIRHCQNEKGLNVHAWCIMPSHMHLIISRSAKASLSDIMRDMKKLTATQILNAIQTPEESRKLDALAIFFCRKKESE